MATLVSTANENTIYWDAATFGQAFTEEMRGGAPRRSYRVTWTALPDVQSPERHNQANEEIASGQLRRFATIDALVSDLHAR
jgi:hypothetical protein